MKKFKAGQYINQGSYRSFQPNKINRQWTLDDMDVIQLLEQADRELGKLDMYSNYIPNIELFISMHIMKEATESTKIEGTQTNIEEALLPRNEVPINKKEDWDEVQNYIAAMYNAIEDLKTLPFSSRLLRKAHERLLQGVRGKNKLPGEFRRSQNWIGGATLKDAIFIPPVHTSIQELMGDLENFVHNEYHYFPELLKIALIHYQFETIHPFLDGNGRVGRLMITLYLVDKGILKQPILYLSDFFEKHRSLYFDNLMYVRTQNNIKQWFKFFLVGVIETTQKGIQTFDNILRLQADIEVRLQTLGSRANNAKKVVQALYKSPLTNIEKVEEVAEVSKTTAYKLIKDLEELNIIQKIAGKKRQKMYLFNEYIALFLS